MICPNCKMQNDPGYQFCLYCGTPLYANPAFPAVSPARRLGLDTLRLVVMIFALWIMRAILTGLPFVRGLTIPNFPLTPSTIVNILVYLAIAVILITYAAAFSRLWQAAFPRYASAAPVISGLIILILLGQLYRAIEPVFTGIVGAPDAQMLLQVGFLVAALILVVRVLLTINQELPGWLLGLISRPPEAPRDAPAPAAPPARTAPQHEPQAG